MSLAKNAEITPDGTSQRTNTFTMQKLKEPVRLNALIKKSILGYFELVKRRDTGNLKKSVLFSKTSGKRGRE